MAIVLGLDAILMRGPAGTTGSTEVKNVKDLTLNLESGEADVTTRATKGWRASVATLKEASLEFNILYDTEDEDYNAFADAYFNNTPMATRRMRTTTPLPTPTSTTRRWRCLSRTATEPVLTRTSPSPDFRLNSLWKKRFL